MTSSSYFCILVISQLSCIFLCKQWLNFIRLGFWCICWLPLGEWIAVSHKMCLKVFLTILCCKVRTQIVFHSIIRIEVRLMTIIHKIFHALAALHNGWTVHQVLPLTSSVKSIIWRIPLFLILKFDKTQLGVHCIRKSRLLSEITRGLCKCVSFTSSSCSSLCSISSLYVCSKLFL